MANEKVIERVNRKILVWKVVAKFYKHLFPSFKEEDGEVSIDDAKFITSAILLGLFLLGLLFMTPDVLRLLLIFTN